MIFDRGNVNHFHCNYYYLFIFFFPIFCFIPKLPLFLINLLSDLGSSSQSGALAASQPGSQPC